MASLLAFPSAAGADHAWNGFHWSRPSTGTRTLTVGDGVSSEWSPYFNPVVSDWNTALGGRLALSRVAYSRKVNVTANSASYGFNGWVGLAQVWLKKGHISKASIKLNETYYDAYPAIDRADSRQYVFCQEAGHILGLDHQTGASDSCMDDTVSLLTPPDPIHPNAHDAEQLATIYNHTDTTSSRSAHERGPFTIDIVRAPRR